jgi:hypothetical protein
MSNWLYLIGSFCFVAGTLLNMLDFNHGALKGRANDPRARDISERINAHIDAALFRARDDVWTQFDPLLDK